MTKNKINKVRWKAGNMIYPLPAAMVSCGNEEIANIVTVGWTGTICTNPAMTYISLRPSRYSYDLIKASGYFVINLTTEALLKATDFCGVRSGRDHDKFKEMGLTVERDEETGCPMILESPVSVVCETVEIKELGSHHMFIANVKSVYIDESYMDEKGKFQLNETGLIAYSHGSYLAIGEELGTFGYSVRKKPLPGKEKTKQADQRKGTSKETQKEQKKKRPVNSKTKSEKASAKKKENKQVSKTFNKKPGDKKATTQKKKGNKKK